MPIITTATATPFSRASATEVVNVLLVDDDELVARAVTRMLTAKGYSVRHVRDGAAAFSEALGKRWDLIVSDIHMPGVSGIQMLRALRNHGCDIPVVLMTGQPEFATARDAVEHGALQYLTKPLDAKLLLAAVERARRSNHARSRDDHREPVDDATFARALGSIWMAFQPIVSLARGGVVGYEALVRSHDETYPAPQQLLEYAARAGRECELGRAIRGLCATRIVDLPAGVSLFVNIDAADLTDPELFLPRSALAVHAKDVVLEITEREGLERIGDVTDRIRALRALGFRVAVDDLGAGYAGLSSIALLEPDYVKLDMSLTRDIAASSLRSRLVASMIDACRDLDMQLIAEGVETESELQVLRDLGCDLAQGYHFARPSSGFVPVAVPPSGRPPPVV